MSAKNYAVSISVLVFSLAVGARATMVSGLIEQNGFRLDYTADRNGENSLFHARLASERHLIDCVHLTVIPDWEPRKDDLKGFVISVNLMGTLDRPVNTNPFFSLTAYGGTTETGVPWAVSLDHGLGFQTWFDFTGRLRCQNFGWGAGSFQPAAWDSVLVHYYSAGEVQGPFAWVVEFHGHFLDNGVAQNFFEQLPEPASLLFFTSVFLFLIRRR